MKHHILKLIGSVLFTLPTAYLVSMETDSQLLVILSVMAMVAGSDLRHVAQKRK